MIRRLLAIVAVSIAVAVAATGALAWITGVGGGSGSAVGAALTAPDVTGVTSLIGKPHLDWSPAQVRPDDRVADAAVTYDVARSTDGGSTWTAAGGTCAGTLTSAALACDDDPPAGSYEYRVSGSFRSWSSAGTTGAVDTHDITALSLAAPIAGTTGTPVGPAALAATLTGSTALPAAGGTISFSYYGPQAAPPAICGTSGGGWTSFGTAAVSGDGSCSPASGAFTPSEPGTYWWYATYGGDPLNFGSGSTCAVPTVVTNATTTDLDAPATGTVGTAIPAAAIAAALSGGTSTPTVGGTVTFSWVGPQAAPPMSCRESGSGWTAAGSAAVDGDGSYDLGASFTPSAPGVYWWFASYDGDTLNAPSTSACGAGMAAIDVSRAQPSLTLGTGSTGTAGTPIDPRSLTATLSGRVTEDGSGSVSFFYVEQNSAPSDCTTGIPIGAPVAEGTGDAYHPDGPFTPSTAGTYWLFATYSGDPDNLDAASECPPGAPQKLEVERAQPSLGLTAPANGTAGTPVAADSVAAELTGRVSQDGTGTVAFFYLEQSTAPTACTGGTAIGLPVAESAGSTHHPSAGFTPATTGTYWLYAVYDGDANNLDATSACPPGAAQELLVAPAQPALSLAVAGGPALGTAGTPFPAASITASLTDRVSQDGAGAVGFYYVEQPAAPSSCTTGTAIGAPVTESAATEYHPDGDFTPAGAGTYWLYAVYGGDANNLTASGSCPPAPAQEIDVAQAQPSLSLAVSGGSITATLNGVVNPDGTGTVSFSFVQQPDAPAGCTGGTAIGAPVAENAGTTTYQPSVAFAPTTPGTYWVYAVYSGDADNAGTSGTCPPGVAQQFVVS